MKRWALWVMTWGITMAISVPTDAQTAEKKKGSTGNQEMLMEEVVVTATRTEKTEDEAPANVTVITREDMERINVRTVDDALKYEAGVFMRRNKGIADAIPRVQLRGLPGQERTLVLLNGLPLNDGYSGGVQWNAIGVENVERIEVIRGPASALYGGNAMGGVINIITHEPEKLEALLRAGYGTDDKKRIRGSVGNKFGDKFTARAGFEYEETEGYVTTPVLRSLTSGSGTLTGGYLTTDTSGNPRWVVGDKGDNWAERWNANLRATYEVTSTGKIAFDFQRGHHEYGYDEPHTYLRDAEGNRVFKGSVDVGNGQIVKVSPANYIYYNGNGNEDITTYLLNYTDSFWDKVALNAKVGLHDKDKWYTSNKVTGDETYDNAPGSLTDSDVMSWFGDIQSNIPLGDRHLFTFGLYFRYDDFDQKEFGLSFYRDEDSKTVKTGITEGEDRTFAVYLQDEWQLLNQLTLYAGLRFDYWEAFDGKSGNIGSVEHFDEPDDYAFSPNIAAVWNPLEDTYIKGSIGRAFRPPNIYELYRSWVSGSTVYHSNPDLDPETLWNFEIGAEQYFWDRRINVGVTYFHTELKDAIERYTEGSEQYLANVSEARIGGVELEASIRPFDWMKLWGNFTYNDSEVKENERQPEAEGKKLTEIPDIVANLGLDLTFAPFTAGIMGDYKGRIYTSELNDDVADVYGGYSERWLLDAKLTFQPIERFFVSFAVDNILDEDYFEYYIADGRSYLVEIGFKW